MGFSFGGQVCALVAILKCTDLSRLQYNIEFFTFANKYKIDENTPIIWDFIFLIVLFTIPNHSKRAGCAERKKYYGDLRP
jgi:hypothetical protein